MDGPYPCSWRPHFLKAAANADSRYCGHRTANETANDDKGYMWRETDDGIEHCVDEGRNNICTFASEGFCEGREHEASNSLTNKVATKIRTGVTPALKCADLRGCEGCHCRGVVDGEERCGVFRSSGLEG